MKTEQELRNDLDKNWEDIKRHWNKPILDNKSKEVVNHLLKGCDGLITVSIIIAVIVCLICR